MIINPAGSLMASSSGEWTSAGMGGVKPTGMVMVGWPVRLEAAVLETMPAEMVSTQQRDVSGASLTSCLCPHERAGADGDMPPRGLGDCWHDQCIICLQQRVVLVSELAREIHRPAVGGGVFAPPVLAATVSTYCNQCIVQLAQLAQLAHLLIAVPVTKYLALSYLSWLQGRSWLQ
jgi:hypothetical protein